MALRHRRRVAGTDPENAGFGVNDSLTPKRQREADEMGAMVARMLRALRRRAAAGDAQALAQLVQLGPALKVEARLAALALKDQHGYSWTEVGWAAGITRQAAEQRWGGEHGR